MGEKKKKEERKKTSVFRRLAFIPPLFCIYVTQWWLCFLTVHTQRTHTEQLKESHPCVYISKYMNAGQRKFRISFILVMYNSAVFNTMTLVPSRQCLRGPFRSRRCDCLGAGSPALRSERLAGRCPGYSLALPSGALKRAEDSSPRLSAH